MPPGPRGRCLLLAEPRRLPSAPPPRAHTHPWVVEAVTLTTMMVALVRICCRFSLFLHLSRLLPSSCGRGGSGGAARARGEALDPLPLPPSWGCRRGGVCRRVPLLPPPAPRVSVSAPSALSWPIQNGPAPPATREDPQPGQLNANLTHRLPARTSLAATLTSGRTWGLLAGALPSLAPDPPSRG